MKENEGRLRFPKKKKVLVPCFLSIDLVMNKIIITDDILH